MQTYHTPGIYKEELFPAPADGLQTGVPAFLGFTNAVPKDDEGRERFNAPQELRRWPQFKEAFGPPMIRGYLARAVRGFFENGGQRCFVVPLDRSIPEAEALNQGLAALESWQAIDLICAPDISRPRQATATPPTFQEVMLMHVALLEHCEALGDRFVILETRPGASVDEALAHRSKLEGRNGALYFPWLRAADGPVPPCGHLAGVYARVDQRVGVHKAPANEIVEGVIDAATNVSSAQQSRLNPEGVNCLRAFPGRGIRVWGARTLSSDPAWSYVNVRRLFLTVSRWIERNMVGISFEPHDTKVWTRVVRELTGYFNHLLQQGALKGATPQEGYYIKCDAETNPPQVRQAGMLVTEIGLAPTVPNEFVVVRITHSAAGISISGQSQPQ
jgi:phage tail sheath protein FI